MSKVKLLLWFSNEAANCYLTNSNVKSKIIPIKCLDQCPRAQQANFMAWNLF